MTSPVYFWNLSASRRVPTSERIKRLLQAAGALEHIRPGDLTAIKVHFGETGVTGFLSPQVVRHVVAPYLEAGAKPFVTDTATLYAGTRGEAVSHALTAARHGFDPLVTGAPVIMADGLRSTNEVEVPVSGKHFQTAYLARDIVEADVLVMLSHFKAHELAGYGGALKNAAMGCASRKGKMRQHGCLAPGVYADKCLACGTCLEVCAPGALSLVADETGHERISVNHELCVGCGSCFHACRFDALQVDWRTDVGQFLERMMEYAAAVLVSREKPTLHLNFVTCVTPHCDCTGFSDAPVCQDIGVLASWDPVAVDQAGLDLVNAAQPNPGSRLPKGLEPGEDKFLALYPATPPDFGLEYAVELGLGSREYELVPVK